MYTAAPKKTPQAKVATILEIMAQYTAPQPIRTEPSYVISYTGFGSLFLSITSVLPVMVTTGTGVLTASVVAHLSQAPRMQSVHCLLFFAVSGATVAISCFANLSQDG